MLCLSRVVPCGCMLNTVCKGDCAQTPPLAGLSFERRSQRDDDISKGSNRSLPLCSSMPTVGQRKSVLCPQRYRIVYSTSKEDTTFNGWMPTSSSESVPCY